MSKILKDSDFNMEGETLYDGKKTLLVNILRSGRIEDDKELAGALASVPSALQKFIISYIENYKNKAEKEFSEKENAVFEEAKKRGRAEGYREGRAEALRSMENAVKNIYNAAKSIENFKNELYGDVRQDVVNLSLAIAKTIVKSAVSADSGLLLQIIADAANKASDTVRFTVCLNPADYDVIKKNPDAVKNYVAKETDIDFLPDVNILPGDVVIKTDFGEIDARIETQLGQIKKIFTKVAPG